MPLGIRPDHRVTVILFHFHPLSLLSYLVNRKDTKCVAALTMHKRPELQTGTYANADNIK